MIVVADSSALVALACCDSLELLADLFREVRVPEAVFRECVVPAKPESRRLETFLRGRVLAVEFEVLPSVGSGLGPGELEAMALYRELSADRLLADDSRARKAALALGMEVVGSLGVLVRAKQLGLLEAVLPAVAKAQTAGIYYSQELISRALHVAGETRTKSS
jgi:uncharacterized protein